MGGHALKNLPPERETRRYEKDEFYDLADELLPKIKSAFNNDKVTLVQSYFDKETFGDMDILIYDKGYSQTQISNILNKYLNPGEIYSNSNVVSFDYKNLQIDLIFVKPKNWESSNIFYMWGDLGNFMGKLFNSYGNLADSGYVLKYGFNGARAKLIHNDNRKVVQLTHDNKKVFDFLGLDFNKFKEGFKNKQEVFNYIVNSKFFDYNAFQWENLNAINKNRNKRRPAYNDFLEYIESHKDKQIEWDVDKSKYLAELKKKFGVDLEAEMENLKDEVKIKKDARKNFSGKDLIDMGIEPKKISNIVSDFKSYIDDKYNNTDLSDDEYYDRYRASNDKSKIIKDFKEFLD